ncbi:DNA polymerase I B, mitochondrial-like isoform X1 [Miscanthus floridulus]|uniref:DNA polymerase I B, mitochondrial-like isoform X1 n=1 Tax=Miscanthus floridulus TaxID=154761 RepID=UPI003457E324
MVNQPVQSVPAPISVVNDSPKCLSMPRASKVEIPWRDYAPAEDPLLDKPNTEVILELDDEVHDGDDNKEKKLVVKKVVSPLPTKAAFSEESLKARKALASIYDKVLVVDNIESARSIVKLLTTKYKSFIHACHTEVADIDAKEKTPVGHGEVICFSIYSANSDVQAADFGHGKTCIWVDVLDGGRGVLMEFAPFFEDPSIKKVHDELILEGPSESAEVAKAIVVECMSKPFYGTNILKVDLAVDAKCAKSWRAFGGVMGLSRWSVAALASA